MTFQLSDVPSFGGAPAWVSAQSPKKIIKKMLPHSCPIAPTPPHPLPHPKEGHPGQHLGHLGAACDNPEAFKRAAQAVLGHYMGPGRSPWSAHAPPKHHSQALGPLMSAHHHSRKKV